jgi:hypothetical protein
MELCKETAASIFKTKREKWINVVCDMWKREGNGSVSKYVGKE